MRGYFGIGVEGISKAANLGALMRTAHAFGASFCFTIGAAHNARGTAQTDTSKSRGHVPLYEWDGLAQLRLPSGCAMVGIELSEDAVMLPSFRHPRQCAYILGPERGSLSPAAQQLCSHIVQIPTRFCINVSLAAALTLYDRTLCFGGFPERPLMPGGPDMAAMEQWKIAKAREH